MASDAPPSGRFRYYLDLLLEFLPIRILNLRAKALRCESRVRVKSPSRLDLGHHVVIQRGSILHCGGKKWCGYKGGIVLDDHVVIGPGCILYGAGEINVKSYTHLGPGVMIITQSGYDNKNRMTPNPDLLLEPVIIGKGCWIGAGAVVLGGTCLGDGCTVGPNSVVKGTYPDGTVLIGNPARANIATAKK